MEQGPRESHDSINRENALALLALKDIEHRVSIEAEAMGLEREFSQVGPSSVKGIEINQYAAELV